MTRSVLQLLAATQLCLRPASTTTIASIAAYGTYLTWLALSEIGTLGDAAHLHIWTATAAAGAWIGSRVGTVARWRGSPFAPPLIPAIGIVAVVAAVLALGLASVAGWIGGLNPWTVVPLGTVVTVAGLTGGRARPASVGYLTLIVLILVPAGPFLDPFFAPSITYATTSFPSSVLLIGAAALLVFFAFQGRRSVLVEKSLSRPDLSRWHAMIGKLASNPVCEPSIARVAVASCVLATGCTLAHRLPGLDIRDGPLIIVVGSVLANLGTTGTSISRPRGMLPGISWLLLSGIARTRSDAARRMLWSVVGDYLFAAGVFVAVSFAVGPDWHLVEIMLVASAACHAYLMAASPSRWLLSSRRSVFVATPAVVAIAWPAWNLVPWGLPTALAACVLSGVVAVYLGGMGIGRIDLDPIPDIEPAT